MIGFYGMDESSDMVGPKPKWDYSDLEIQIGPFGLQFSHR